MRKKFCLACALYFATAVYAQEAVLSFEEAVQTAVAHNYAVRLKQAALLQASGKLKSALAGTDVAIGADTQYSKSHTPYDDDPYYGGMGLTDVESDQISSSLWAQKTFAFGLQSRLSLGLSHSLSSYKGSSALEANYKDTNGTEGYNRGTLSLELSLPIFKSFNASVTANNIAAARHYHAQLEYELTDAVCQTLLSAASSYWAYLSAHSTLQQLEAMQKNLQERSTGMERLISAGVRSRNDLLSMQVSLIEIDRNVVNARVAYEQAQLSLLQTLGIEAAELPAPSYDFPSFDGNGTALPDFESIDAAFIERICARRPDLQALERQLEAAQAGLKGAQADARPDTALSFALGSSGAIYGDSIGDYLQSFAKNVPGTNMSGGISFSMSLPNNARKGNKETAQAALVSAQVQLTQARQTLSAELRSTIFSLRSFREQVLNAENALSLQKQLYANEQKRFEAGLITIDDMGTQDSRYLDAQTQYYQLMIAYLQAVLQYKYLTGNLVEVTDSDTHTLHKERLYSLE